MVETESLDQTDPIRKDLAMALNLTPTNCQVNDLWIRETLAKAERHHALTRADAAPAKPAAPRFSLRMPRIALVSRLAHRPSRA